MLSASAVSVSCQRLSVYHSNKLEIIARMRFRVTRDNPKREKRSWYVSSSEEIMAAGKSECLSEKFTIISGHTACLPMSADADKQDRGVSKVEATSITELHNLLRASIKNATDMQVMAWDEELSAIAQRWADNCDIKHDSGDQRSIPGRLRVGQNIGYNYKDWNQTVQSWFNEQSAFHYGNASLMQFEKVGHFTQVVRANSTKVGCGYTKCSTKGRFYVCNYGPGQIDWSKPYTEGTQCDSCRRGGNCITSGNNKGLCDGAFDFIEKEHGGNHGEKISAGTCLSLIALAMLWMNSP
ncbi:cysteine-rich venom protein TEL1-like [Watersipora subatra]|uniref:cysteine-rich venom protein TEL1-like n=1 Tax=Watersipora subatra TaxID=2589382 RepID=UPI00355C1A55